jgi:hypothetical protein
MICRGCAEAAALGRQGVEAHQEFGCKGCECQHRVGGAATLFNMSRLDPERMPKSLRAHIISDRNY